MKYKTGDIVRSVFLHKVKFRISDVRNGRYYLETLGGGICDVRHGGYTSSDAEDWMRMVKPKIDKEFEELWV